MHRGYCFAFDFDMLAMLQSLHEQRSSETMQKIIISKTTFNTKKYSVEINNTWGKNVQRFSTRNQAIKFAEICNESGNFEIINNTIKEPKSFKGSIGWAR